MYYSGNMLKLTIPFFWAVQSICENFLSLDPFGTFYGAAIILFINIISWNSY